MTGRHRRVSEICQLLRKLDAQNQLSDWARAHLGILEAFSAPFELNLKARQQSLERAARMLQPHDLRESFLFLYEQSGLFLHLRNYKCALEYALKATERSFDQNSRLSSDLNACIAQEALGLDVQGHIQRFRQEICHPPQKNQNPRLYKEFIDFSLRTCFRTGDFAAMGAPDSLYFNWLCQLPQIHFPSELKTKAIKSLHGHESYTDFALNTLTFKMEVTELSANVLPRWCDRLYLWTWTWFKNPSKAPLSLILDLLERFPFEKNIHCMTTEDRLMVRHSLMLLSLIDLKVSPSLENLFQKMAPIDYESHPFLKNERCFIVALQTLVRHGKIEQSHTRISSFNGYVKYFSPDNFNKLELTREWPGFQFLAWQSKRSARTRKKYFISPHLGRFAWIENGVSVESLAVARAFAFFLINQDSGAINLSEFNHFVFGLEGFDSFMHYRKVYNLVARMKNMAEGDFQFKIRGDVIHFKIHGRKFFLCENGHPLQADVIRWRRLLSRIRRNFETDSTGQSKKSDAKVVLPIFTLKEHYSRAELQRLFQWSKPMAVRTLKELCQKGMLVKEGQGRRTIYKLSRVGIESELMST